MSTVSRQASGGGRSEREVKIRSVRYAPYVGASRRSSLRCAPSLRLAPSSPGLAHAHAHDGRAECPCTPGGLGGAGEAGGGLAGGA